MTPDNNWRAGDLAVCLKTSEQDWFNYDINQRSNWGPEPEQVLMVRSVCGHVWFGGKPEVGLEFQEFPRVYFPASGFRKIQPDAQPADDAEIIALIKGRQPATASSFQFPVAVSPASDRAARWVASPIPNLAIHRAALALEGN